VNSLMETKAISKKATKAISKKATKATSKKADTAISKATTIKAEATAEDRTEATMVLIEQSATPATLSLRLQLMVQLLDNSTAEKLLTTTSRNVTNMPLLMLFA